jgi:hypothetical protein
MKPILFTLLLGSFACLLSAQPNYDAKRDYVWIFGGTYFVIDSTEQIFLDFKQDTMVLSHRRVQGENLFQTNTSICDTAGNFLFFSNGCVLSDSSFNLIPGAGKINNGPYWAENCESFHPNITDGYTFVNGCWILPVAEKKFKVLYVEEINNFANTSGVRFSTVIQDKQTLKLSGYNIDRFLIQTNLSPEKRAIVRHANGRDWWLVNNSFASKDFYISYIDSSENVYEPKIQDFPELPNQVYHGAGQSVFSSDGTIYACFDPRNLCQIYDFNRCSGELSNVRLIQPLLSYDSIFSVTGIAISPNSRFLYLMTATIITQYDLQSANIEASAVIVAVRDNWVGLNSSGNPDLKPSFYQSQLGPDGKIYVFNAAGRRTFAVIESPDSLGLACNVIQHKYHFPQWGTVRQPPRFPNFRLGPLEGSPCDSIPLVGTQAAPQRLPVARLKLSPNPTSSHTVADITVSDYRPEQHLVLRLTDITGKVLRRMSVPAYTPLQRIETSGLAKGLYFVSLEIRGRVAVVEKLVVVD